MDFKLIKELDTVDDDAYNFYFGKDENIKSLFYKIFVADKFYEKIKKRIHILLLEKRDLGKLLMQLIFVIMKEKPCLKSLW